MMKLRLLAGVSRLALMIADVFPSASAPVTDGWSPGNDMIVVGAAA